MGMVGRNQRGTFDARKTDLRVGRNVADEEVVAERNSRAGEEA
jgi:hypothetical protein